MLFYCDLCRSSSTMTLLANYIGYTCRYLHQRVEEHKHSVIGKHFRDVHDLTPDNLIKNFKVIKKCRGKLECLIYEMLLIKNKRPKLNTQADSIRAKLFTWANTFMLSCWLIFSHFQIYKHAFALFLINSFDNDDMKSSKGHVVLVSLIFLLKCSLVKSLKTLSFRLPVCNL